MPFSYHNSKNAAYIYMIYMYENMNTIYHSTTSGKTRTKRKPNEEDFEEGTKKSDKHEFNTRRAVTYSINIIK